MLIDYPDFFFYFFTLFPNSIVYLYLEYGIGQDKKNVETNWIISNKNRSLFFKFKTFPKCKDTEIVEAGIFGVESKSFIFLHNKIILNPVFLRARLTL